MTARYRKDPQEAKEFFASFRTELPQYGPPKTERDTMLLFTVQSPVKPLQDDMAEAVEESLSWNRHSGEASRTKTRWFSADSTGEAIRVSVRKYNPYFSIDSAEYWKRIAGDLTEDEDLVIASRERVSADGVQSMLLHMRDTNSSRSILHKVVLRNHMRYLLTALTDSAAGPSDFVKGFFDTFRPYGDSTDTTQIFAPRGTALIRDFHAADSALRASARMSVDEAEFRDADAPGIINLIRDGARRKRIT